MTDLQIRLVSRTCQILPVVVNTLPTAPIVTLLPNPAYTDDELVANHAWDQLISMMTASPISVNGLRNDGTLTNNTAASQPATGTTKGELWSVRIFTMMGCKVAATEANIVISNAAPMASAAYISPALPNAEDLLSCNISISCLMPTAMC